MFSSFIRFPFIVVVLCFVLSTFCLAIEPGSPCSITVIKPDPKRVNNFTAEQEVYLGEILADWHGDSGQIVDDAAMNAYLKKIGDRLVKQLPPTNLDFRFYVYESPIANAYSIGGGRVYVTRKLIGFTRSEDELAAVMAHELGHIVTHQMAYVFSEVFKHQIDETQFTDKKDMTEKFNRMLESKRLMTIKAEDGQDEADRVGAEILVRAGYRPEALYEFYDRFTANKGKKGNWFSDVLGSSGTNSKRYREMIKTLPQLPAECISKRDAENGDEYKAWRTSVVAYDGQSRASSLPGLIAKRALDPPLQDQLHTLRFSPDGRHVLAQDNGAIYVLTREPFAIKFAIPAEDAFPAHFTADSASITFYTPELRVEQWNVESGKPSSIYDLHSAYGCMQTALSVDAHTLACIDQEQDSKQHLVLIDTATQDRIFEKKDIRSISVDFGAYYSSISLQINFVNLTFSPDGKYLLFSSRDGSFCVDVASKKEVPLPAAVKNLLKTAFVFLDDHRILGLADRSGNEAMLVDFPDGRLEKSLPFGTALPYPVTKGDFVLMRPIRDYDVGVVDLKTGQIIRANKLPAMDIYGDIAVAELGTGEIGLFGATATPVSRAKLPQAHFASVRASAVSRDFRWLAISEEARGAIWNVETGQRLYNVKSFRGAYFDPEGAYVDFPKQEKAERSIAKLALPQPGITLANKLGSGQFSQHGPVVFTWKKKHTDKEKEEEEDRSIERFNRYRYEGNNLKWRDVFVPPDENETLEVRDSRTGTVLWTRTFEKRVPRVDTNVDAGVMTLAWRLYMPGAKAELESLPKLAEKKSSFKDGDYLIEVLDLMSGTVEGGALIDTNDGAFTLASVLASRSWIAVTDSYHRAIVYNLKTGECTGKVFGVPYEIASASNELVIQKDPRHYVLMDARTMSPKAEFAFPLAVTTMSLSSLGDRMFAVTENQTTYLFNTNGNGKAPELNAAQ